MTFSMVSSAFVEWPLLIISLAGGVCCCIPFLGAGSTAALIVDKITSGPICSMPAIFSIYIPRSATFFMAAIYGATSSRKESLPSEVFILNFARTVPRKKSITGLASWIYSAITAAPFFTSISSGSMSAGIITTRARISSSTNIGRLLMAAAIPALSESKRVYISFVYPLSFLRCSVVRAVPRVATAFGKPYWCSIKRSK